MPRTLIWIKSESFHSYGCSQCDWIFKASGNPVGDSLDKMKRNYEAQRDKEFAAHVCAEHPRITKP
jgi:hypothetical protein